MAGQDTKRPLELPPRMRLQLETFRQRVWVIKLAEGLLAAACGLLASYLFVFVLDRFWDTSPLLRAMILVAGTSGLAIWFPLVCHRWVWRTRRLEQVARLLRYRFPGLSDQLLGIVELLESEVEQERSAALCRAAMLQVDREAREHDFTTAVPHPRHRRWAWAAGLALASALAALLIVPAAGTNAAVRWLLPWKPTARYTFAQLDGLPDQLVVPFAEPFPVHARLAADSAWSPRQGAARYGDQAPIQAPWDGQAYRFQVPPQKEPARLVVKVGDASKTVAVAPTVRPELRSMTAAIQLPSYLQYSGQLSRDVRGGSVSMVKGSRATFRALVSRQLDQVFVDGQRQQVRGQRLQTFPREVVDSTQFEFTWRDHLGLTPKQPFVLSIKAHEDEPPTLLCSQLSAQQVVLDEDVLSFQVLAQDDFGIREIGMEWEGIEDPIRNPDPARGERIVSSGGPEARTVDAPATFAAQRYGIAPQSLKLRLFVVDYLPARERIYSPTYILHVLSPQEHAIWLTNQLRKWFRQAQGVYEREQQLYQLNRELRALSPAELDRVENRRRVEKQAAAERANGRRLGALTAAGGQLIQQAARNRQFNVATLENWAEMLNTLEQIADNRMPSVAELLSQAAQTPSSATQPPAKSAEPAPAKAQPPQVGVNRDGRSGPGSDIQPEEPSQMPAIADIESGANELGEQTASEQEQSPAGAGRLSLPGTMIQGGGTEQPEQPAAESSPQREQVEQAVEQQESLLAEFAEVAEELQKILNNLEGSTFVKRLKAAARRQQEVARDLNRGLQDVFGATEEEIDAARREQAVQVAQREAAHSDNVYLIQEDLEAYYNRVQQGKFRTVLNEMRDEQVVSNLRRIAGTVEENMHGQSIAQAEFWSDALDRWAEQLVGPG